jgi:hypothetical protein
MKLQRNLYKSNLNATWQQAKSCPFWELLTKSHLSEMGGSRISCQDARNQGIGRESSSLQQSPDWEWGRLERMKKCAQEENLCIWKPGTKQRAYMLFLPPGWVHGVFPNWHSFWSMFMSICVCSPPTQCTQQDHKLSQLERIRSKPFVSKKCNLNHCWLWRKSNMHNDNLHKQWTNITITLFNGG